MHFPPDFLFGAATAVHQVEGGLDNNNWSRWEESTRPDARPGIFTGERSGRAADHWLLFEQDLGRMTILGQKVAGVTAGCHNTSLLLHCAKESVAA